MLSKQYASMLITEVDVFIYEFMDISSRIQRIPQGTNSIYSCQHCTHITKQRIVINKIY